MLIQLHGFSDPRELFADARFAERFRNMWYFAASICFRGTESYADYMAMDSAFEAMQREPLLPLTPKQRGMIGSDSAEESLQAQIRARRLIGVPKQTEAPRKPVYYMPDFYGDADVTASDRAAQSTRELCAATRKTGSHVCRSDVCHKGKVGRYGFCRLGYRKTTLLLFEPMVCLYKIALVAMAFCQYLHR